MTANTKMALVLGALVSLYAAVWGLRHVAYMLDPIVRAFHG